MKTLLGLGMSPAISTRRAWWALPLLHLACLIALVLGSRPFALDSIPPM